MLIPWMQPALNTTNNNEVRHMSVLLKTRVTSIGPEVADLAEGGVLDYDDPQLTRSALDRL